MKVRNPPIPQMLIIEIHEIHITKSRNPRNPPLSTNTRIPNLCHGIAVVYYLIGFIYCM